MAIDLLGQVDFLLAHNPLDDVRAAELANVLPQFEARWTKEAGRC